MDGLWEVRVAASADRDLTGLPAGVRDEALDLFLDLAEDPFPSGTISMDRYDRTYRVRLGGDRYRVIFRVDRKHRIVTVFRVRARKSAYLGMKKPR